MKPPKVVESQTSHELSQTGQRGAGRQGSSASQRREAHPSPISPTKCDLPGVDLSDTILTVARNGNILFANRSTQGRTVEELLDGFDPEEHHEILAAIDRVCRSHADERFETLLSSRDGRSLCYEVHISPCEGDGEIAAAVVIVRDITDRKRREGARQALARLGQRLAATSSLESLITIVQEETNRLWHWDAHYLALRSPEDKGFRAFSSVTDGNGRYKGPQAEDWPSDRLSEFLAPVLKGQPLILRRPPKDPDPVLTGFRNVLQPSVSLMYSPLRGRNGIIGVLSIQSCTQGRYDDIDLETLQWFAEVVGPAIERVYASESLRQSEERYRSLAENAADLLWTMDMNLRLTYISPSVTRIRGYTIGEAMDLGVQDILTPHSYQLAMKALQEELESEKKGNRDSTWSRTMELQHVCKDGSTVWSEAKMTFLRDPYGRPVGILGVTRDITDRKRAEEALQQSEEKYRMLIDNIQDGVFIIQDATMQFANEALARMVGYKVKEIIGMDFSRLVAPEHREFVGGHLRGMQAGERAAWEYEFLMLKKDHKTKVIVNMNVGTITYQGRAACIGTLKDITQREHAEEEKRHLQEQLAHAQKIEALGTLAGGIAHEFNNINAAIIGYVDLSLQSENVPDRIRRNLGIVRGSAVRGADLTRSLLTFSTRDVVRKTPVDLREVVAEVLRVTQNEFTSEGIDLTAQHTARVPQVMGDAGMLASVVMNLVVNARHAMLASKVKKLTIRTGVEKGRPFIMVEDTGCGIAKKNLPRVFDPFFTTKGSLVGGGVYDGKAQGTGLGLSVCHSIIERHGGQIKVKSQVGRGATFTVYFPASSKRKTTRRVAEKAKKSPFRVMVVDDEDPITELLVEISGQAGYEADGFTNPTEALEALRHERYSLAFIDLQMPEMAGEAFMEAIDGFPLDERPLKVVVTGRLDHSGRNFVPPNVFAALPKPFTTDQVLHAIQRGVSQIERRSGAR